MAALKEPVKIFIVQALACRDTPQEVVEQVKQEFGVDISRSQCECYDPTKYSGRNLSKKFVELFELTREKFDKGLIDIPIANKYYRLKQYQRQLEKTRNVKTALKILEQAAKDIGGQFTNRQEITGKDGGPVQTVNSEIPVPMDDYLKARREVLDEY
ncbi:MULTISPECIES: DUF2280 domain-containing protein [Acinetobacter calcoaceticus/baumannii complex]|jgi:hypothetical protein|uniref:DUF2280 domain-containing protein n=1 Tax=Acinetobacter calcoaceticus/baumannii complex TaxID=909768 RepID=UPI0004615D53|nr:MULTISPECIES: DUF2280 domain-containing protein [Acinetobacter calcoaceticus/baumannii complex]KCX11221.1 hypothetical protein J723_4233 [Acinetobacter sp. 1264765]MBU3086624.1 DUF2280 domain-containing protein [Acinetobacter seifertii]MDX8223065.1 DUF2280 domain-containing protein [Acinetobacter pittii]OTM13732.1 hypothetical protein B9X53_16875 [Acinetobacter pittii]OUR10148.1 hypothetical protein B4R72_10780 [Acinetobacter pittii]